MRILKPGSGNWHSKPVLNNHLTGRRPQVVIGAHHPAIGSGIGNEHDISFLRLWKQPVDAQLVARLANRSHNINGLAVGFFQPREVDDGMSRPVESGTYK